jgi:nucleotide-binding universal stress UspA family protein
MTRSLIHAEGRVLAAVDPSVYADSVAEHAAWAAARLASPLELLHAIERAGTPTGDLSGSLSLGARETLLEEMASLDEQRGRLAQERGRLLLTHVQAKAREAHGIDATIRQRHGTLVDTLLELEPGVRLFVLGKRGEHADFASGHLGSNLERVVRAVHRPVLVASRAVRPVERFLIAFDGSETTRRCVQMICASPLLRGLACEVLTVGDDAAQRERAAWAQTQLRGVGFEPVLHVVPGVPDAEIARVVSSRGIDLLVMGAYGHSRIRTMIVGSTTTQVLRTCPIPVLLLR